MSQLPSNQSQQPSGGDTTKGCKRKADDDIAAIEGKIPLNDDRRDEARREYQSLRTTTNKYTIDEGTWLEVLEKVGHKQKHAVTYTSFKHIPLHKIESKERQYERQSWAREIEDVIGSDHKYYLCIPMRFRNPNFMPQSILDCSTTALKAIAAGLKHSTKADSSSGVPVPANAPTEAASQPQPEFIDLCTPEASPSTHISRQIEALQAALPHKQAQVSALQDEVSILNAKKIRAVEEAMEAVVENDEGCLVMATLPDRVDEINTGYS